MRATRCINDPSSRLIIKKRSVVQWHDQVDLTPGMSVMRPDHIVHIDDIDRKAVQVFRGLENAAITNATGFALTQPSFGGTLKTALLQGFVAITVAAIFDIKPGLKILIQRPPLQPAGQCADLVAKIVN